jgi:pimeloyl-ACP methyl ester carboxylesterase
MKRFLIAFVVLFSAVLFSCVTIDRKNPYPNIETIVYDSGAVYEFKNAKSDTLIVFLDGQGWRSALGYKEKDLWQGVGFGYPIVHFLGRDYSIMIPEKFNRQIGKDYAGDPQSRRIYTLNNLVENYAKKINAYLRNNNEPSVILAGFSEGAAVLPMVYEKIEDKDRVKGLAALAFGGLSIYEQRKILAESELDMPDSWRDSYKNQDEYRRDINIHVDSLADINGSSYRWLDSFWNYKPLDYYSNIEIPVLFIHGTKDINVPVESTRYVQENLPDKPFTYVYVDSDHGFGGRKAIQHIKTESIKWLDSLL